MTSQQQALRPTHPSRFRPEDCPTLLELFDGTDMRHKDLRGVRLVNDVAGDYYSFPVDSTHNNPFLFQGTNSQFWFCATLSLNFPYATMASYTSGVLFGVMNQAGNKFPWVSQFTSNGAQANLNWLFADSYQSTITNCFNPTGNGPFLNALCQIVGFYDGAKHGTDASVLRIFFNNVKQITPAGTGGLPQVLSNPASGNGVAFVVGRNFTGYPAVPFSIRDLVVGSGNPTATDAAVAAAAWNKAATVNFEEWLNHPDLPTPLAYYSGEDGMTADGVAPFGNMINLMNPGTYDLVANNVGGGRLHEQSEVGIVSGRRLIWGYHPSTPNGQIALAPIVRTDPDVSSVRHGKVEVYSGVGPPGDSPVGAARAICRWPGLKAAMGSSGSVMIGVRLRAKSPGVGPMFGACNLATDLGITTAHGNADIVGINTVGVNPYLAPPVSKGTCTITAANPCVVTCAGYTPSAHDAVIFTTTNALPAPLFPGFVPDDGQQRVSFVSPNGIVGNTFRLNGYYTDPTDISTAGGTQAGVHTLWVVPQGYTGGTIYPQGWLFKGGLDALTWVLGTQTVYGAEVNGYPFAENTYLDDQYHIIEFVNDGSGTLATHNAVSPPTPTCYRVYIDGVYQTTYHDDGGTETSNKWAADCADLNAIFLFCLNNIAANGAYPNSRNTQEYSFVFGAIFGPGPSLLMDRSFITSSMLRN